MGSNSLGPVSLLKGGYLETDTHIGRHQMKGKAEMGVTLFTSHRMLRKPRTPPEARREGGTDSQPWREPALTTG